MSDPIISVIIPVHNGGHYLAAAIDSALEQTRLPDEVIVVDDGSADGSAAIARSFGPPVRVLTQANLGPAAARNLGVVQATGDLLGFLDADDLWLPDKLTRQVALLQNDPSFEAVLGGVENFVSPELDAVQRHSLGRSASQSGAHHIGALLVYKAAFQRIGAFDERWRHGEFIEWWARAMEFGLRTVVLGDLVLRRRLHAHNMTRCEQDGRQTYLPMLREVVARRRAQPGHSEGQVE